MLMSAWYRIIYLDVIFSHKNFKIKLFFVVTGRVNVVVIGNIYYIVESYMLCVNNFCINIYQSGFYAIPD